MNVLFLIILTEYSMVMVSKLISRACMNENMSLEADEKNKILTLIFKILFIVLSKIEFLLQLLGNKGTQQAEMIEETTLLPILSL